MRSIRFILFLLFLLLAAGEGMAQGHISPRRVAYAQKDTAALWFDHYQPQGNANGISVIFVHGGSFTGGHPDNQFQMGAGLAKMGYHVFVLKYRLYLQGKSFGCQCPVAEKTKAIKWAAEDAWDATQYLLLHYKELGIDTSRIFISGSSAGAEAILNLLFDPFRKKSISQNARSGSFRYAGAMSFAGAVLDINTVNKETWVPLLLMHGTADQLVPFGTAAHRFCLAADPGWMMFFGSYSIYERAKREGLPVRLHTFSGVGHEASNYMFRRFDEMDAFMRSVIDNKLKGAREIVVRAEKKVKNN